MKALIDAGVTYESVEQVAAGDCFGTPRPPIPPAHPLPSPRTAHPSPSPRTAYPLPSPRTAQPLPSPRTAYPPRLTLLADREHRRLDVRPGRRLREDVARPARRQGGLDRPRVAPPQDDAHDGEPAVGVLSDLKRFPRSDARLCLPCPVVCSTSSFQHDSGFDRKSPPNPQIFGHAGIEHMEKYGTTVDHFAKIGYKNHLHRY